MTVRNRKTLKFACLLCYGFLACATAWANNMVVSNVQIVQTNNNAQFSMLGFDLRWDNSWRDATNFDAAWVFVKYRAAGNTGAWSHATLHHVNGLADGHIAAAGATIETPSDGKGVFVYRNAPGSGNVNWAGNQLRWDYAADGLATGTHVNVKVFAIEMVYVPQGSFSLGDGETDLGNSYGQFEAGTSGLPYVVTSEASITLGGGSSTSLGNHDRAGHFVDGGCSGCVDCSSDGCLGGSGDDFNDAQSRSLPIAFPKGYDAFYCMKYEMTQQQMADMLNFCTPTQQNFLMDQTHFFLGNGNPPNNRWGFLFLGVWQTVQPYVPMIYLDWQRAAAYADWSGLRPMTELEFEKACRGTTTPVLREYAWGNANISLATNLTISNQGTPFEGLATGYDAGGVNGNCWINGGAHNMQVVGREGVFAADPGNTGRVTSGASIYGIMELSGNAWERAVSVGHSEGRKFTGLHGDGVIDAAGYANVPNWPGSFSGSVVSSNVGVGYRGGGLAYPGPDIERNARVSSRRLASGYWNAVIQDDGARFVRSAP